MEEEKKKEELRRQQEEMQEINTLVNQKLLFFESKMLYIKNKNASLKKQKS